MKTHRLLPGHSGSAPLCASNRLGADEKKRGKKREKFALYFPGGLDSVPAIRHS